MSNTRRRSAARANARARKRDERQLDLLDWLDSQPSFDPRSASHSKARSKPKLVAGQDVDEDQLDLVEMIAAAARAA